MPRPGKCRKLSRGSAMDRPALDLFESARLRNEAEAAVEANAPAIWSEMAMDAVEACAMVNADFIVDEVWRHMRAGAPTAQDNRAMGPVMRRAKGRGLIEPTDTLRLTEQVKSHRQPRRVWRSLVYGCRGIDL